MGRFNDEAATGNPINRVIYLTEDASDGASFRPTVSQNLTTGTLEVLTEIGGVLSWKRVPDPDVSPTAPGSR